MSITPQLSLLLDVISMVTALSSARHLTKSLFVKACECPRKLAYALTPSYIEQKPSPFVQNLAENGKKIGAYSRLLYRDGIEVGDMDCGVIASSMEELVDKTNKLLNSNETVTLFEAAIQHGPFYARVDILEKNGNHLHLMEVKAKSWDSREGLEKLMLTKKGDIKSDYLPYLQDVAFQKHVMQLAFPEMKVSASLVLPDKALVNTKIPNLNSMFRVIHDKHGKKQIHLDEVCRQKILHAEELLVVDVDVDEIVNQILDNELKYPTCRRGQGFRDVVTEWGTHVQAADDLASCFEPSLGSRCGSCEFRVDNSNEGRSGFEQCWREAAGLDAEAQDGLVVDLFFGGKTTEKLIHAEKYHMADIKPADLGLSEDGVDHKKIRSGVSRQERQWYQVSGIKSPVLDKEYLEQQMFSWKYPYHFIDFETIAPVLPFSTNKAPYSPLAFQFSHHRMESNGNVEHVSDFLHAHPGDCPNQLFLEALSESLGSMEGTVLAWGAHENTTLTALLRSESGTYPVISELLTGGDRAIVDLMNVLSKGYYAPGSGASSSMKKLLLPTLQLSTELQMIYSQPTYSGKNFTDMQWWVESSEADGPCDPYSLLGKFDTNMCSVVHGGDAIAAFEQLQREDLDPTVRTATEASLLRYCELDTLAMAMMVQGVEDLMG